MSGRSKKILLVDDSESFLMYVSILLHRMGFKKVIPSNNGTDALKLLRVLTPDIVLLDIGMPQMDGVTVLRHIKGDAQTSNIPVVMITISSDKQSYEACERLGCCGYIKKPINIAELNQVLYRCISSLTKENQRQFLRSSFNERVAVTCAGIKKMHYAVNISQRGMYIRMKDPFPVGTEVSITLPLKDGSLLNLKGNVIYIKNVSEELFKIPPGMAIEFMDLTSNDSEILRVYISELLTKDIIDEQDTLIIKKDF
jgi:two-component system chemotaxis response regulator CheY